jgi:hypothetical protein
MNARRTLLALALVLLGAACSFAQQGAKKPLSEADVLKLVKSDLEEEVIVTLIKKRGVSFKADDAALKRLKDGGVSEAVLAALRPAEDEAKPEASDDKPLATARTDDGLTLDVLEVRPTKNETLLIRWRYHNPTARPIELIAATPRFATRSSPPNTVTKFYKSVHYIEGKFQSGKAFDQYILVEGEAGARAGDYVPCAKKLGTDAVVIRPDQDFELYAEFPLPHSKTEKMISLTMLRTPLIKNIPIQKPEK